MKIHLLSDSLEKINRVFTQFRSRIRNAAPSVRTWLHAWLNRGAGPASSEHAHLFYARSYPGSRSRHYHVYAPSSINSSRPRPLVIVLHGCQQDNNSIEQISAFNQLAERHGFLVGYPFITSYKGLRFENCWGWWFDNEIHAGAGEVEDLWQIVEDIKQRYPVDAQRIHVTGLSSGAGMAVAMMVAHADRIASGASVAGVPYSERSEAVQHAYNRVARHKPVPLIVATMQKEMATSSRVVPIQIVHSRDDKTVDIQSAKNLRDSWGICSGVDTSHASKQARGRKGNTDWEHSQYLDSDGRCVIETLFLEGPGHGWYGGRAGDFSYPDAPNISEKIWEFFVQHPL